MNLYRYSPIETKEKLFEAIEYVAKQAAKLYFRQTGNIKESLINSLTVFAHYPEEFKMLTAIAAELGEPHSENNGPYVKLHKPMALKYGAVEHNWKDVSYETTIEYLRIRKPDPYRMQVGCCDLNVDFDGQDFAKATAWPNQNESPRVIERISYDMLELFDPSIDVLTYVLSKPKTS